jgi:hypothetical protein
MLHASLSAIYLVLQQHMAFWKGNPVLSDIVLQRKFSMFNAARH